MYTPEFRYWYAASGIVHLVEMVHGGQHIVWCIQDAQMQAIFNSDAYKRDVREDGFATCLVCAAWGPK